MREALFRGKDNFSGDWYFGNLLSDTDAVSIITDGRDNGIHVYVKRGYNVMPESVGEYTGEKDINKKMIFEGDIAKYLCTFGYYVVGIVKFGKYQQDASGGEYEGTWCKGFYIDWIRALSNSVYGDYTHEFIKTTSVIDQSIDRLEVIGNSFENPDLLIDSLND